MTAAVSSDILDGIVHLEPAAHVPSAPVFEALRMTSVMKEYRTRRGALRRALDDFDLTMARGEIVAVVGPSGCGKSTILRLAAGLETPTSGEVWLGRRNTAVNARQVSLGVMCQKPALTSRGTVRVNVAAPFEVSGRPVDHERLTHLLEPVGLSEHAAAHPRQLAAEMRQRVSLARNLALEPSVLLLDEPFGALSPDAQRRLVFDLQAIVASERLAVLIVTSDASDAVLLADRVVVMRDRPGRVATVKHVGFSRPRREELMQSDDFHSVVDELGRAMEGGPAILDLR